MLYCTGKKEFEQKKKKEPTICDCCRGQAKHHGDW